MPPVASETHAASQTAGQASARSSQRNRPANGPADAPTPFAALIDRANAGDGDAAPRPDTFSATNRPADGSRQPDAARDASRDNRRDNDHRDAGRRDQADAAHSRRAKPSDDSRAGKPARDRDDTATTENDAAQNSAGDTAKTAEAADDIDAKAAVADDGKDAADSKDACDADAALADAIATVLDPAQAGATDPAKTDAVAAPVATAQVTADPAAAEATSLAIDGDKPATTPALLAAQLTAAGDGETKVAAKTATDSQTAKTADAGQTDDSTLHAALKGQQAGETSAGKPAQGADAKPADGEAKPAVEAKAQHATGAEKPADAQPAATNTAGSGANAATQGAQNQTHLPQLQHAAPAAAPAAGAAPAAQTPAVPIEGVAVEIAAHAKAGKHSFDIRLDPPELGRIDVRLDVDRHGQVTSRLVVDRPETLDLLRRDAAGLERALQDAGLKTGDNGLQFSLRDQTMQQQAFRQSRDTAEVIVKDDAMPPLETTQRGYRSLAGLRGGVDIRV